MANTYTLLIEKDGTNKFRHTHNGLPLSKFMISDFECSIDGNLFKVVEKDGASRFAYLIENITVKDNTDAGVSETFVSPIVFENRLRALGYTPYFNFNDVGLAPDEYDAIHGASLPSAGNVFATMADVGSRIPFVEVEPDRDLALTDLVKILLPTPDGGPYAVYFLPTDIFAPSNQIEIISQYGTTGGGGDFITVLVIGGVTLHYNGAVTTDYLFIPKGAKANLLCVGENEFALTYELPDAVGISRISKVVFEEVDITVPLGFSGAVINLNNTNSDVTYTVAGTLMTITGGADAGDVLIF